MLIKSATKKRLKPIKSDGTRNFKTINAYEFSRLLTSIIYVTTTQGAATRQPMRNLATIFGNVSLSKGAFFIKPGRYF